MHFKALEEIKTYVYNMQMFINKASFYGDYMMDIIDTCDCVIKTYNAVMEGNYENSDLVFSYLELLWEHARLLYENRDAKIKDCINKTPEHHRKDINENELMEQFEEFNRLLGKILHKNVAFHFNFELMSNYENI